VLQIDNQRLTALVFAVFLGLVAGCGEKKTAENPDAEAAEPVGVVAALPEFTLIDQGGVSFGSADLNGKVWIADFIFTRCAGTCPMQTAEKVKLQEKLRKHAAWDEIQLVSFTVDPEYDTAPVLAEYARAHGADSSHWKFLTGSRGDLWNLSANGFKMDVAEDAKNTKMPILHSSRFTLVDRSGRIRGYYDGLSEEGRAKLEADLEKVLAESGPAAAAKPEIAYQKFPHPKEIVDPPWLKSRQELQLVSAGRIGAFHDFKFEDVVGASGITFQNRIVDDAGKYHKAVHYDHGNGIAVADVDGDGLLDIYFTTQIGSNELWRNLGGGKFRNITSPAIALADKIGVTASFADTDNDGDPDLFATTVRGGNYFFENDGTGSFTDMTEAAGLGYVGHSSGGVFFDYDKDGLLDLFLCNVGVYTTDERGVGGYCVGLTDAFEGHTKPEERNERSTLYRNEGGNKFVDVSEKVGLLDESWTGNAAPIDYNEDGWTDLYVLSMQGHDQLYENVGGEKFVKKSREVFPKTSWGAMGIQVFDFDNDGHQDIFITDMHSDMSEAVGPNREKLKSNMKWDEKMLQSGGMSIFGNAFFRALGDGKFEEVSDKIGAENYWPWGLSSGDLNADGFIDVFIASSMNFPFRYGVNSLLLNDGGKRFEDSEFILGVEPRRGGRTAKPWFVLDPRGEDKDHALVAEYNLTEPVEIWGSLGTRASVIFDLDNDGDLDIVTNEFHDGPMVLRSDLADKKSIHWLKVRLVGKGGEKGSNKDGLGAVVTVMAGGKSYTQVHDGISGYLSHSVIPPYFGLGEASTVEKVTVVWPSGREQIVSDPKVNSVLVISED
jgi:cytochrome oxidase Cu insertion factor (SCO1/SenC/PrrC family)